MKLDMLHKPYVTENKATEAGHIALDLAGFVPGAGEVADIINAIWYIKEKKWVSAALSLISVVPAAGDIAAKGIKYLGKGSVTFGKFMAKYGDDIAKGWIKAKPILKQSKKLEKYIDDESMMKIDRAIEKVFRDSKKWNKETESREKLSRELERRIGESKSWVLDESSGRENVKLANGQHILTDRNPIKATVDSRLVDHRELRYVIDRETGDAWIWDSSKATHSDMMDALGLKCTVEKVRAGVYPVGSYIRIRDKQSVDEFFVRQRKIKNQIESTANKQIKRRTKKRQLQHEAKRKTKHKPPKKTSTTTVGPEAPPYRWGTGEPMSGDGYDEHMLPVGH